MRGAFFSLCVAQLNLFDENAARANSEALISLMGIFTQQGRDDLFCRVKFPAGVADEAGDVFVVLYDTACRCVSGAS